VRAAAQALGRPAVFRKLVAIAIVGGTAFLILFAMVLLRFPMTMIALGALLAAAGGATVLFPEVGLFALLLNALIGLSHIGELPRIGPLSIPIAFEGVLALAFAVQVALGKRRTFLAAPQHLLLYALSAWIVISMLVSGRVEEENLEALRNLYLVRFLIFLLVTNILVTKASMQRLLAVVAISNVGLLAVSVATSIGLFGQERIYVSERMLRTSALVHNPNNLAFELTTMLIIAVCSFFVVRSKLLKGLCLALAGANLLGILSTLSRSGFISLTVVLLFMSVKLTRNTRVIALVLLGCLAVGLLSGSDLVKRFKRIDEIRDVDRWDMAVVGFNAASDNPVFGLGLGNFIHNFAKYNTMDVPHPLPTHNMYLDLATSAGYPALIFYVAVIAVTWWNLLKMEGGLKRGRSTSPFHYWYNLAVQCFLVNLCVFGLSGDVEFEYSVFVMLAFGILLHHDYLRRAASAAAADPAGAGGPTAPAPLARG